MEMQEHTLYEYSILSFHILFKAYSMSTTF
jgi:hypothetical protein